MTTTPGTDGRTVEQKQRHTREVCDRFFQYLVDKDMEGWFGLWDDEAVNEFPFAPPNYPTKVEGIAAIREYMKDFPANIEVTGVPWIKVHHTTDPDVVIMENQIEGTALATGNPYNLRYICVIEFKDGKIARYVDYWNALEAATALGGMDAFQGAFNASTLA
ncbi:nuclear transport factor 2 family protein [Streptomyces sp. NPDC059534]|uniref:nuclear transport factor 2 family protein n=1 Tax=Streptomyces sp. NPDC059534 TaxID=3346859 RepID=UPI0036A0BA51